MNKMTANKMPATASYNTSGTQNTATAYKEPGIFTRFGEWLSKNSIFLIGFPLFAALAYAAVAYLSKELLTTEWLIYGYVAFGVLLVAVFLITVVGLFIYERLNAFSRALGNWLGMN